MYIESKATDLTKTQLMHNTEKKNMLYATNKDLATRLYLFFLLNSAEHGIFSANKYENASQQ